MRNLKELRQYEQNTTHSHIIFLMTCLWKLLFDGTALVNLSGIIHGLGLFENVLLYLVSVKTINFVLSCVLYAEIDKPYGCLSQAPIVMRLNLGLQCKNLECCYLKTGTKCL